VIEVRFRTVNIETTEHGTLHLRGDFSLATVMHLEEIIDRVDHREFAVQAISCLLWSPQVGEEEVRSWPDELLASVVRTWSRRKEGTPWALPDDELPFPAFLDACRDYVADFERRVRDTLQSFGRQMEDLHTRLGNMAHTVNIVQTTLRSVTEAVVEPLRNFQTAVAQSTPVSIPFRLGTLFEGFPDVTKIVQLHRAYLETNQLLDQSGYPFLAPVMPDLFAELTDVRRIPPRVQSAVVTKRLRSITCSSSFETELHDNCRRSSVLAPRWRILEKALRAHRNRDYELSIPASLTQVEGIFTDALVLRNLVVLVNETPCERDPTGQPRLDKHGSPIRLHGLGQKVRSSDLRNEHVLSVISEFLVASLIPERNGILHGSDVTYARARLSVQSILLIYALVTELAYIEGEER
jgi:hypothetical protein